MLLLSVKCRADPGPAPTLHAQRGRGLREAVVLNDQHDREARWRDDEILRMKV